MFDVVLAMFGVELAWFATPPKALQNVVFPEKFGFGVDKLGTAPSQQWFRPLGQLICNGKESAAKRGPEGAVQTGAGCTLEGSAAIDAVCSN